MFYSDRKIREKIIQEGMITDYSSIDEQLQPNGFDFRVGSVSRMYGTAHVNESTKYPSTLFPIELRKDDPMFDLLSKEDDNGDYWSLIQGAYLVTFLETVKIPSNVLGLGRPRSTLCRNGVSLHTGVWDAGYEGKSTALLVVHAPVFELGPRTRIMQMVFAELDSGVDELYNGAYQHENITMSPTVHVTGDPNLVANRILSALDVHATVTT